MLRQGVNLTVNRSEIRGNYAYGSGGGMYVINFGETGSVGIHHSTIANNTVTFNGAGILLRDNVGVNSTFEMDNSTISGNLGTGSATYPQFGDGGAIFNSGMALQVRQSTISNNQTANDGGGIFVEGLPENATVLQTTIYGNTANGDGAAGGNGGGIALRGPAYFLDVTNSVVSENDAFRAG